MLTKGIINYTNWTVRPAEECHSSDYDSTDDISMKIRIFFMLFMGLMQTLVIIINLALAPNG